MIGIPLGLLYANAGEWFIHKYVLHGLAKDRRSWWAFHWHEHHRNARKADHYDADYARPFWASPARRREVAGLVGLAAVHAPLLPVAPFLTATVWWSALRYYRVHKRSHLDPAWAREHLPWHVDHHMGPDQHKNWCVTHPWFDVLLGTRVPWVGTEREAQDRAKRARRRTQDQARAPEPAAAVG